MTKLLVHNTWKKKILEKFSNSVKIMTTRNKNIVMPKNRDIDDGLFAKLEEKDILEKKAALILRRKILGIEKQALPDNLKLSDMLKGELSDTTIIDRFLYNFIKRQHSKATK